MIQGSKQMIQGLMSPELCYSIPLQYAPVGHVEYSLLGAEGAGEH
jgi:hypothetical protein